MMPALFKSPAFHFIAITLKLFLNNNHSFFKYTLFFEIGICCFSAKDAILRNKSKEGFARNQDNVYEWDMSTNLFRWETVYTKVVPSI
jgi:hypothetical protein